MSNNHSCLQNHGNLEWNIISAYPSVKSFHSIGDGKCTLLTSLIVLEFSHGINCLMSAYV